MGGGGGRALHLACPALPAPPMPLQCPSACDACLCLHHVNLPSLPCPALCCLRWEQYVDRPPSDPHRQFCAELVARLCRLSFHARIHALLPPKFRALLGPPPQTPTLPGQDAPPPPAATGGDGAQGAGGEGAGAGANPDGMDGVEGGEGAGKGEQGAGMEGVEGAGAGEGGQAAAEKPAGEDTGVEAVDASPEDVLAGQVLREVRSKATAEEVLAWMEAQGVEAAVGAGPVGPMRVLMRALLVAGAKSPSHLNVALERYARALGPLMQRAGEEGQEAAVAEAAEFYAALPQKV